MLNFILSQWPQLITKTAEQLYLVIIAIVLAAILGIPLAVLVYHRRYFRRPILGLAAIMQTIPGLAMLAFFIPVLGIGKTTALVTLVLYALLPIVRNSYTGLSEISHDLTEAGRGLGMTAWQQLRLVELPLAVPSMISGLRIATVMATGMATLAAFIGAGGLGDFINQGLAMDDNRLILLGAIPAAIMALALDSALGGIEKKIRSPQPSQSRRRLKPLAAFTIAGLFLSAGLGWMVWPSGHNNIVIGSKKFEEQYLLADLMGLMVERNTNLTVRKRLNLGNTSMIHQALVRGDIDLYPEYTGTAYQVVMKDRRRGNARQIFNRLNDYYQQHYRLKWLKPFAFENCQALAITNKMANQQGIHTLSDLAKLAKRPLRIGAPAEFLMREDAYAALIEHYALKFDKVRQMEPGLAYQAINNGHVNVIMAFTTDGRLQRYPLTLLQDDRHAFPAYQAAPVVREQVIKRYPQVKKQLAVLAKYLTPHVIRKLNYRIMVENRPPMTVAEQFLKREGLIP